MPKYKIADLIIELSGPIDNTVSEKCAPYKCNDEQITDVEICINLTDNRFKVPDETETYGSGEEYWYSTDEHLYEYLIPDNDLNFLVKIDYHTSGKKVDVYLFDVKKHYDCDDTYYLSNTMSFLFHHVAVLNNRLVLHSSSVAADGFGVAFSADSGVGKSTHTGLWMKHIAGCRYINDDTPVIYNKNGTVYIYGTPFAGSTGINNNIAVPLKAIVFIKRGDNNIINKLDTPTALTHIMTQLVQPSSLDCYDMMFSTLGDILSSVPVYELTCNMEYDAVKTSYEGIFNKQLN